MAITGEALSNFTDFLPEELAANVSVLITLVQALGGVLIIYIIIQIVNLIINRRKNRELTAIKEELQAIKTKLDSLTKK